jgi:FkbM family methyltransferase
MIGRLAKPANRVLRRFGWALTAVPKPLLWTPAARLEPTFELVMADYLTRNPDPFVVQVGAFNGVDNDPLRAFVVRHDLRGVLVEPQPEPFAELTRTYDGCKRVKLRRAAVGLRSGTATLYRVKPGTAGPGWLPQIASFNKAHLETVPGIGPHIVAEEVPAVTFDDLLTDTGADRVDVLVTDTEGFDYDLITAFDLPRRRPAVVQFEHVALPAARHDELLEQVIRLGYQVAIGLTDTLAYRPPEGTPS